MVVCDPEKSDSCVWILKPSHEKADDVSANTPIDHGQVIRVEHCSTGKNLHTHAVRSPISRQYEVSAFGGRGLGDINDDWKLEIIKDSDSSPEISLRHAQTGHYLHSHSGHSGTLTKDLQEVTSFNGNNEDNNWIVEIVPDELPVKAEVYITLKAPPRLPAKDFFSLDQVSRWIRDQEAEWDWISVGQSEPITDRLKKHIHDFYASLEASVSRAKSHVDTAEIEASLEAVKKVFAEKLCAPNIPWSNDSSCRHFRSLSDTEPNVACAALAAWFRIEGQYATYSAIRGVQLATAYEWNWGDFTQSTDQNLTELSKKWDEQFSEQDSRLRSTCKNADESLAEHATRIRKQHQSVEELLAAGEERLKAIEETYDKHMALKASVDYWAQKSRRHRSLAIVFGVCLLIAGSLVAMEILNRLSKLSETTQSVIANAKLSNDAEQSVKPIIADVSLEDSIAGSATKVDWHVLYWQFATIVALATFAIWALKILVRLLMSNLHQREDAEERVTMMKTFLALKRDQSLTEKDDIRLVLESLFRQGTNGLLKDDSGPATPLEVVMKNFDKN